MTAGSRHRIGTLALALLLALTLTAQGATKAKDAKSPPPPPPALDQSPEGQALLGSLDWSKNRFIPEVKKAFLAFAKAQALRDLAAAGKSLPNDFLVWIDSDPIVQSTVYGARIAPANVLLMLRSLELDLGTDIVRQKYTQLALAMAVVHAKEGPLANLSPRPKLTLVIPPNPLKPVNTKDPSRPLDLNDHIINFLNDHAPLEREVKVATTQEGKKKVPVMEKRKFPLVAADVFASAQLQKEFNAYMKAHGQTVEINCGDHIIYPDRHDGIHEPEGKEILKAFRLFRTAYEAKGLLPPERDPAPTPAEHCAFLIRNNEYVFPPDAKRDWPRYPLTSPWPTMTLLVADAQPLREREDIWLRFRDKGEYHTYGEYIGGIAQQYDFQSARRLAPYDFPYGSIQMMFKDGGVCGAMANIAARSHNTLGTPSCTAGQPGHCALIYFHLNPKDKTYECKGGQFVTGGPDKTSPHTSWPFGDTDAGRGMLYYQTIAWAINYGLPAYLDSTLAYDIHRLLSPADRAARSQELLASAMAINPYNILLIDAAQATAATPQDQIRAWQAFSAAMSASAIKPGCPSDGLYNQHARDTLYRNLAKQPVPTDKAAASEVYAFLKQEKCNNPETLAIYQASLEGVPAVLTQAEAELTAHLASPRTEVTCELMAGKIQAAANRLPDKKLRTQWATDRWQQILGHENYLGRKNAIVTDPTTTVLAKLSGKKLRSDNELIASVLEQVVGMLKSSLEGERDPKSCRALADRIAAVGRQVANPEQKLKWQQDLAAAIQGKEDYRPLSAKPNAKPLRDPCADAIKDLTALPIAK